MQIYCKKDMLIIVIKITSQCASIMRHYDIMAPDWTRTVYGIFQCSLIQFLSVVNSIVIP